MTQPPLPFGDPILHLARVNADSFRDGFLIWLAENAHVWAAFEREANRVWSRGRKHYSARTICEVLRHESALADTSDWKINGNNVPDLARLYVLRYPDRSNLFEFRVRGIAA